LHYLGHIKNVDAGGGGGNNFNDSLWINRINIVKIVAMNTDA